MAFSDWYELIHRQSQGGQSMINVYHFERDNVGVNAQSVAEAFNDSIGPLLAVVQSIVVNNVAFEVRSLDNPADFFTRIPNLPLGIRPGGAFAQFTAATVQFNRTRSDMKNGQKRFAAGVEADSNNEIWAAGFLSDMTDVASTLLAALENDSFPGIPVCRLGVLKRVCTIDPAPVPCPSFRLPENDAELEFYLPLTATVRATVRSQVSRKRLV